MSEETSLSAVELAAELTVAWLANNNTRASTDEAVAFLTAMHKTVGGLTAPAATEAEPAAASEYTPAVTARKSLASKEHIVSMIDGRPYRTLTRHLGTHGLTPAEYRSRYNLPATYPMTAPAYSEQRREMAKRIGLGRKPGQKVQSKPVPKAAPKPRKAAKAKGKPEAAVG
ncbi:MucR family transcriptional regulator [Sphingomonas sp. MG17]|uniref:MucR family transcriptional regulator n=1 Tax=Sphingomonas tagetis TaxID=2949092 RepID=A0A9X2HPT9_9SPHN|nr:MucR family transcriptional regulator [Sphingomonas tagetis]MCP3733229.1 MucR family transcriptional regulator [Sphingomonas tagetis]